MYLSEIDRYRNDDLGVFYTCKKYGENITEMELGDIDCEELFVS
jgi:hypothetical protein